MNFILIHLDRFFFNFRFKIVYFKKNKTGLQLDSRPVEQILGFYPKGLSAKMCLKNV